MGGDGLYGRLSSIMIGYFPVNKRLVVGPGIKPPIHSEMYHFMHVPYSLCVVLRSPNTQDKSIMLMETEADWNLYKRWSLIGFTGIGNAYSNLSSFNQGKSVATIGTGFRYLLMRKLGAQMGMDFAVSSNGDFALYMVFGCSWLRSSGEKQP